jgi:hypothetical protein
MDISGYTGQVFREVAELRWISRRAFEVPATDAHAARGGLEIAAEHFHDRGLAGAVVAEKADDLPLRRWRRKPAYRWVLP